MRIWKIRLGSEDERRIKQTSKSVRDSLIRIDLLNRAKTGSVLDMYLLALHSKKSKDIKTAKKWYRKTISYGGEYGAKAWNDLGNIAFESEDFEEALRCYKFSIDGGQLVALYNFGIVLEKKGDINGAIDFFDRACAAGHPTAQDRIVSLKKNLAKEGKAHYLSGLKYSKQGNFRQAEHWYLQSTAIDSEYAGKAWNDLGNLAFKSGDTGKALERYGRAISAGLAVACYNYAYTLEISSKNSLAALSFYREARKGGYTKAESRIAALELNLANIRDRERARQAENKYQEGLEAESLFDFPWAREAFETAASLGHTGANIKLLTLSQQPQHRSSMTHREAEFVMAEWCRWWGIKDARPGKGQKDKGVDIESKHIVGQVKHRASASTQEDLQKLHSNMNDFGKAGVFFSRSGFTKPAKDFANQSNIKIAIFEFNWHGVPKPLNEYAKHIVSRGHVFQN